MPPFLLKANDRDGYVRLKRSSLSWKKQAAALLKSSYPGNGSGQRVRTFSCVPSAMTDCRSVRLFLFIARKIVG
jgi:hypothetical protein